MMGERIKTPLYAANQWPASETPFKWPFADGPTSNAGLVALGTGPIHHIYINCWLPVFMWSVMDKQVTSTPPQYLEMGGFWLPVFTLLTTCRLGTSN